MISSYDRSAPRPRVGSRWVWEIDLPHARALVEVVEVRWNGEEWWVRNRVLLGSDMFGRPAKPLAWNDLSRFWEACTAVAARPGVHDYRQDVESAPAEAVRPEGLR